MKRARVILSPEAEEVYNYLVKESPKSKREKAILNGIKKKVQLIQWDFHYGEPIAKSKIPEEYKKKYDVTNLFWVDLPYFWRMLYTLTDEGTKIEIIAFVLGIMDHPTYDKKFGYGKK